MTESFTGRVSNENIDVVHFSMVVVLSNKAIIPFMRELCSAKEHSLGIHGPGAGESIQAQPDNHFGEQGKAGEFASSDHRYYRYGAESVVEVEMVCEYIFNKQGYDAIKPESIKSPVAKPGE